MLEGKFAVDTVRKFETNSEAAEFFHLENADPPRLHYCSIVDRIALRCFIYGSVKDGACSLNGRDDGWDTVDSEGRYRFRYCRPTIIAEMIVPQRQHFVGFLGDLEDCRRTLAFTNDGRIYLLEDAWRKHEEAVERIIRVVCQDGNLDPLAFDVDNTEFIGYSWFRDEQYAGTEEIP
jgi:hypothetical protein